VTPAGELEVVRHELELLDSLRLLHPLDPESECAYVTLRDREKELLGTVGVKVSNRDDKQLDF
jgi:hypothetical protein